MNYIIFNDAEMLVEAENHYLFNKMPRNFKVDGI